MYGGILILLITFGILFIIETKSINTLANYIGITILIAILIGIHNCEYISYLLILVQISGLAILFGFIIMLFPKNHTYYIDSNHSRINNNDSSRPYNSYFLILFILFFIPFIYYLFFNDYDFLGILSSYNNIWNDSILNHTNLFISKLAYFLYYSNSYVFNFLFLTLFLLFAIIALFFLLIPTPGGV